jgi:hypothetical protein
MTLLQTIGLTAKGSALCLGNIFWIEIWDISRF